MEKTKINVTTIDYYHRDRFMNIQCGLLPRKLNKNKSYIDNPHSHVPFVNLNVVVPDSGAGELKMESLLEYIRQKPFSKDNQKPDFVTNKQLLKCIASSDFESLEVRIVRIDEVIYMLKHTQDYTVGVNFGKVFEHFLLKESDDEELRDDGTVTKAVFKVVVPLEKGTKKAFTVMYSGAIDAIGDPTTVSNTQDHLELKVTSDGGNDFFWKHRSCQFYWQCVLSNVKTLIIGSRTGKHPNDPKTKEPFSFPEYSLFDINALKVKDMPLKAAKAANDPNNPHYKGQPHPRNQEWTVEKGEEKLRNFLQMVHELVKNDGDGVTLLKENPEKEWTIKHEKNEDLYGFIVGYINGGGGASTSDPSYVVVDLSQSSEASEGSSSEDIQGPSVVGLNIIDEKVGPHKFFKPKVTHPENLENSEEDFAQYVLEAAHVKSDRKNIVGIEEKIDPHYFFKSFNTINMPLIPLQPAIKLTNSITVDKKPEGREAHFSDTGPSENCEAATRNTSNSEVHLDQAPGLLQTQPKSKIVFNAPFDDFLKIRLKITNPSDYRIGFEAKITPSSGIISIFPKSEALRPGDTVELIVSCEPFDFMGPIEGVVVLVWKNIPLDEEFNVQVLEGDGVFRRKTLRIEFND